MSSPSLARIIDEPTRWLDGLRADAVTAWAHPLIRQGTIGTAVITLGSFTPAFLPPDADLNALGLAWLAAPAWRALSTIFVLIGVGMLLEAWLRLRPTNGWPGVPTITWALWSLPMLIAPPLFSRDAYSYAAQGHMVEMSWDPYSVGPFYSPGSFSNQVDPMWAFTPAPYGPLALQAQHLVVAVTGGNAYLAAVGMRVWGILSVALIAYALPRLAEHVGVARSQAVWFGLLNPLVILHLVGGAHNDAVMIALTTFALLLAARGQLVLGVVAVAAGAGFKQTGVLALIGVVGLALAHRRRRPASFQRYAGTMAWTTLVALAVFAGLTQLSGLGWGWVPNLTVPAALRSLLSPPTFIGSAVELLFVLFGVPASWRPIPVHVMQGVGMVAAVAAIAYLAWKYGRTRPMVATTGAFLVLCLGSPVVHPWYLLWGFVLLGATKVGDRVLRPAVWVTMFLVAYSAMDAAVANGTTALILSGVAGLIWRVRVRQRATAQLPTDDSVARYAGTLSEPSSSAQTAVRSFPRVH